MEQTSEKLRLLEIFQQMKNKTNRLIDPVVQAEGLTPLQCCVLLQVAQGYTSVGAVSEQTQMGQANTSTLCKKLEQAGYLTRARNPEDERVVVLSLTRQGQETLARIGRRMKEYEVLLEGLPGQVKEDILRGLTAIDLALDYLSEQTKGE